jgi:hypothetical protein
MDKITGQMNQRLNSVESTIMKVMNEDENAMPECKFKDETFDDWVKTFLN